MLVYSPQAVCLAEFKQIRSIKYNTQSDGRTLLLIEIEGAKQVRTFSLQYQVVKLHMHNATLVVNQPWPFFPLHSQPFSISVASLAIAENMADLIDGYCRLLNHPDSSLIAGPNKSKSPKGKPQLMYVCECQQSFYKESFKRVKACVNYFQRIDHYFSSGKNLR